MDIKKKLIIVLSIVGVIPAVIVGVTSFIVINSEAVNSTSDKLVIVENDHFQAIDKILSTKQEAVANLANKHDFQTYHNRYIEKGEASNLNAIRDMINMAKVNSTDIAAIYSYDNQGHIIASTASDATVKNFSIKNDFVDPLASDSVFWVRKDATTNLNMLEVSSAIRAGDQIVGGLVFEYQMDDIEAITDDYLGLGTTGETMILAENTNKDLISLNPLRADSAAALKVKQNNLSETKIDYNKVVSATDYKSHDVRLIARKLTIAGWVVVLKINASEAFSLVNRQYIAVIATVIFAAIMTGIAALYISRQFLAPLLELNQKAHSIILGDFSQRIRATSKDEVGQLANTFNTMSLQLSNMYRALQAKVELRTRQLNNRVRQLRYAKVKDEAILDSISYGMVVVDNNMKILMANMAASDLLGIDNDKLRTYNAADINFYDERHKLISIDKRPISSAIEEGKSSTAIAEYVRKNGTKVALNVTATPIIQNNRIIGALDIMHDVTRELVVDRMKTEFISLASHQLRTPLSAIKWFSEMLISGDAGKLKKDQVELAQNVYDSTDRMIQLVNSLLNVSRIESGRIIVTPAPTDLRTLIESVLLELKPKIDKAKQNLVISIHDDLPKIKLDARLIRQVYLNILSNANKYTPKGGEISLIVSRRGKEVLTQISDTGYGIPKEEQYKVFGKFFRAANIIKIETDGTGLGMYLVKSIIKLVGGGIWFESEENKGTTFWFTIPTKGMKAHEGEVTLDS